MSDTLANAERLEPTAPTREVVQGYWPGSATSQVEHWRARALAAERELVTLRRNPSRKDTTHE